MNLFSFDLEYTFFEVGFFLLFVGMIILSASMLILQRKTRSISVQSRSPVLRSAVLFYSVTAICAVVFREYLSKNSTTEYAVFMLGASAVVFAWFTIPFVIEQWGLALDKMYTKKLEEIIKQYHGK